MNSRLDCTLVMSESDKSVSFMDSAIPIFDFIFTLVTVAMVTGEAWLLLHLRTKSILNSKVSCCVNRTFRD